MTDIGDNALERLLLHHDLHRFFCRYFDMCEAPRLDDYPLFFTADAQFNIYMNRAEERAGTPTVSLCGPAEIRAMTQGALINLEQTHHTIGSFWVDGEDGQIIARAHLRAYHRAGGTARGKDEESLSTFRAVMVREGEQWKIARFDYVLLIILGSLDAFPDMDKRAVAD